MQMFSHKLLKVLAPRMLMIVFGINILLADEPFYAALLILQPFSTHWPSSDH